VACAEEEDGRKSRRRRRRRRKGRVSERALEPASMGRGLWEDWLANYNGAGCRP
jgi:hypothetical protein